MTGAPERIWAWGYWTSGRKPQDMNPHDMGQWCTADVGLDGDEVEYVRADLYDAAIARAEAAEAELAKLADRTLCDICGERIVRAVFE